MDCPVTFGVQKLRFFICYKCTIASFSGCLHFKVLCGCSAVPLRLIFYQPANSFHVDSLKFRNNPAGIYASTAQILPMWEVVWICLDFLPLIHMEIYAVRSECCLRCTSKRQEQVYVLVEGTVCTPSHINM